MLLRHYIHQRLQQYYAQAADRVVGGVGTPIAFGTLWGQWGWNRAYGQWMAQSRGQWLTPTELFQPYYSQCIAEWIVQRIMKMKCERNVTTDIVEVGGGRGTNALCVLDHLETNHPTIFRECFGTYHLVDASPTLLELQKTTTQRFRHRMKFRQCDMLDVVEGRAQLVEKGIDKHTVTVFCEVLDNLPHDRVVHQRGKYFQTELVPTADAARNTLPQEIERALTDPLLQRCLETHPPYTGWYPSVAVALLQHLALSCDVWIADFDHLETTDGAPLITDMQGQDHPHYWIPDADSNSSLLTDILFPTNFGLLQRSVQQCNTSCVVQKQAEFLRRYPDIVNGTRTLWRSYTPMLDDFPNCSVLTIEQIP